MGSSYYASRARASDPPLGRTAIEWSHHEDMLLTFNDSGQLHATYWDNEGHRIEYDVTVEGKTFT